MTDLRDARLTDVLPKAVADQQEAKSLSDAWHDLTVLILDFADNAKIYTAIDRASDELLDILAVQFRTPRYRQDYDIETKRRMVKSSLPYYMTVGTKAAVEDVMREMYGKAYAKEWFEYNGTPGCFRIKIDAEKPIDIEELLDILHHVKRTSAHLDTLELSTEEAHDLFFGFASVTVPAKRWEISCAKSAQRLRHLSHTFLQRIRTTSRQRIFRRRRKTISTARTM